MIKVIKKIYKSSFVQSTFNMIVIASCILLGGFIAIYENKSNAKIVANEYFQCYLRNDFKKMYEYVDVDEDEFINLESFKNKLKNEKKQVAFTDYTVSKAKKDGKERIVTVSYVNGYNDKKEYKKIKMILFQKDVESDIDSSLYQIDSFDLSDIKVYARNYSSKGSKWGMI